MSRPIRPLLAPRAALLVLVGLVAGCGDGRAQPPTLKTINVDGDLSDWQEILLNPSQVTLDGDGSSVPCEFSTDLDCSVQSTGRDLRVMAWTYDADYLYVHVHRQGNTSNERVFWFYLDISGPEGAPDRLMGASDVVMRVRYSGSTGVTANALYRYLPADAGGDPMADGSGRADGHTLPGTLLEPPLWLEGVPNGGTASGEAFEERVPWALLGVPAGTPASFHVSSSNDPDPAQFPGQIDDNLGGPEGGVGSLGFHSLSIAPDHVSSVAPGQAIRYRHEVRNLGSWAATYELAVSSTLGLPMSLREDADGDGDFESLLAVDANGDGDFDDPGDLLARDIDGNGFPEVPAAPAGLSPSAAHRVEIELQTAALHDGSTDVTTVVARAPSDPERLRAAATDTTLIGEVVLRTDEDTKTSTRGQSVPYSFEVCNHGPDDVIDLSVASTERWDVSLYADPECDGVPGEFLAQDRRGDGSWDILASGDTDADGSPDTGVLSTAECRCYVVQVQVPNGANEGTAHTTTVTGEGNATPSGDRLDLQTRIAARLELFPDHLFVDGTEMVSGPDRAVYFPHVARNNWVVADRADFAAEPPVNDQGWTVRFWSDPDGDGSISDGALITRTDLIPPNGGESAFVVEVMIPPDVPEGTTSMTSAVGAAALETSFTDDVVDELGVSAIATYADPLFAIPARYFAPCETVHVEGTGLERRQEQQFEDRYDLVYFDAAATNLRFHDAFAADPAGVARDAYAGAADDVPGTWTIELREETLTIATREIEVEAHALLSPLATDRPSYPLLGADVGVTAHLANGNAVAGFLGSTVEYVVLDPTGDRYLVRGAESSFAPHTGSELTRSSRVPDLAPGEAFDDAFVIPRVMHEQEGLHVLVATWRAACGTVLGTAVSEYVVGGGEDCSDGRDNDGDGLIDCDDPECDGEPACVEVDCTDGVDGDGDGLVDCDDPDCADDPACLPESRCADGADDDGDGLVDCADPDCATDPDCPETDCANGADDDGDGHVDCADLDCANEIGCLPESDCGNREDDDADGLTDCEDPDCAGSPSCVEVRCDDGADDDADGLVDCADGDCLRPGGDCDRDGEPDETDCDPADPLAQAEPATVDRLDVSKAAGAESDAEIRWTAMDGGLVHDVITGRILEIWGDRGLSRATCLVTDWAARTVIDARRPAGTESDGFYYLVRAENPCAVGPLGHDSFDTSRTLPPNTCP